jgi:hypothetical protein
MNETSSAATAATTLELSALKALQDILHNRIMQKKEMPGNVYSCVCIQKEFQFFLDSFP